LKTRILAPRQVLAQIDQVLAQKLSPHDAAQREPLKHVVEVLCNGRGYLRATVQLTIDGRNVGESSYGSELTRPAKPQMAVSIKIASRILGSLRAENDAFHADDRVLLKQVAARLARFLTSRGKALVRSARETESGRVRNPEERGYQPASAKTASLRMAAGEGRRT
jgi:hypothetical protein